MRLLFLSVMLMFSWTVASEVVQVLHTNDLHGFLDNTQYRTERGGYAAIKTLFDQYEDWGIEQGIQTFRFDAGDFMEGNLFYLARNGLKNFKIMDLLNYDAVVIGNHDWLMGTTELNNILEKYSPQFHFLGANFKPKNFLSELYKTIKPYHIFELASGVRFAVLGLTTNEILYSWRVDEGSVVKVEKAAKKALKKLKEQENVDFVFTLTHLGHLTDARVINDTTGIDLAIGGHSHNELFEPLYAIRKDGHKVPIVQAGAHGNYIGRILIELEKGKPLKILKYELIPVENIQKDLLVQNFVITATQVLNDEFGEDWLNEVVAQTEVPLTFHPTYPSPYTDLVADSIREKVDADMSIYVTAFGGANIPVGPVTRKMIFNSVPRIFDFEDRKGWYIWKVKIYGLLIKSFIQNVIGSNLGTSFSGVTFDYKRFRGRGNEEARVKVSNIRVRGEKIKRWKRYSIAMPEGIVRGGLGISGLVKIVLNARYKSEFTFWDTITTKLRDIGTITLDNYYSGNINVPYAPVVDRIFVPPPEGVILD